MTKAELTIKNCHFVRPCHAKWETLDRTRYQKNIRSCTECNKQVHLVESDADLAFAVYLDYCVAIPLILIEQSADIDAEIENYNDKSKWASNHLLGVVSPPTVRIK